MSGPDVYRDHAVRAYVMTRGRARPSRNTIRPETLLVSVEPGGSPPVAATREERVLLRMCTRLLSVAEAAAYLELPVSIVSVVASDLVDAGSLTARSGVARATLPDRELLLEVLDGLRRL